MGLYFIKIKYSIWKRNQKDIGTLKRRKIPWTNPQDNKSQKQSERKGYKPDWLSKFGREPTKDN